MAVRLSKGMYYKLLTMVYKQLSRDTGHSTISTTRTPISMLQYLSSPYMAIMMTLQGYVYPPVEGFYAAHIC